MTDERKALLGDKEAAKRLTEKGVLLECCGAPPVVHNFGALGWAVACGRNGHIHNTSFCDSECEARLAWNTRAPILSAEEIERLED